MHIYLLFNAGDIVSIHTLASASSAVFSDLLHAKGVPAWRDEIVKCFPGKEKQVIETFRRAERFFKHADRDPDGDLEFDEVTNDETIIVATLEYGELIRGTGKKLTSPMSMFQMRYFANRVRVIQKSPKLQMKYPICGADPADLGGAGPSRAPAASAPAG